MATVLYIDGGCSGNGQKDLDKRRMIAVVADANGMLVNESHHHGGSNNIAELIALRDALRWCEGHGVREAEIYTDSENTRAWARPGSKTGQGINDRPRVLALKDEIAFLRHAIRIDLIWLPREQNLAGHIIEGRYGL